MKVKVKLEAMDTDKTHRHASQDFSRRAEDDEALCSCIKYLESTWLKFIVFCSENY